MPVAKTQKKLRKELMQEEDSNMHQFNDPELGIFRGREAILETHLAKSRAQPAVVWKDERDSKGDPIEPYVSGWFAGQPLNIMPESLIVKMIKREHDLGHQHAKAILRRLEAKGWATTPLRAAAERHVQECLPCARFNQGRTAAMPPALDTYGTRRINEHWAVDTATVPLSARGYNTMLSVTDIASKYIEASAVPNKKGSTIARMLLRIALRRGFPSTISSDGGSEFCNRVVEAFTELARIDHRTITPYNPMGNAIAENSIGRIRTMLDKICDGNFSTWEDHLCTVAYVLNTTPAPGMDASPQVLFFARPVAADNFLMNHIEDEEGNETVATSEARARMMAHIVDIIQPGLSLQQHLTALKRASLALGTPIVPLKVGQNVLYKERLSRSKGEPRWLGPASVSAVGRNGAITLMDNDGTRIKTSFRPQELKIWKGRFDTESFEVKAIHQHRPSQIEVGKTSFLVEWTGYPHEAEFEWVEESDFNDRQIIRDYMASIAAREEIRVARHGNNSLEVDGIEGETGGEV